MISLKKRGRKNCARKSTESFAELSTAKPGHVLKKELSSLLVNIEAILEKIKLTKKIRKTFF